MKEVLLIRHGATAGNLERRYIGRTDEPLCPLGRTQVQTLAQEGLCAHRLFVSPMVRTKQTAEILFPGKEMEEVPALRETDFGVFEGKTAEELSGDRDYQSWLDSFCQGPIPGGEQIEDFKKRCREGFLAVMERIPEGEIAAFVVHGGTIMAIMEGFSQPPCDFYTYHIKNGSCLHCRWQENRLSLMTK